MFNWIQSFFISNPSSVKYQGTFYRLVNPDNNYTKRALIQNAELQIQGNRVLYIENSEYDPEQESIRNWQSDISDEISMIHYIVFDDEEQIHGMKWNNTDPGSNATMLSFEFLNQKDCEAFRYHYSVALFSIINPGRRPTEKDLVLMVDEEGVALAPAISQEEHKREQSMLVSTVEKTKSKFQEQKPAQPLGRVEEEKAKAELKFKQQALQQLSQLYDQQDIYFMSPGNLFEYTTQSNEFHLRESGVGLIIARIEQFVYAIDIVKSQNIILRTLLNAETQYFINEREKEFNWIQPGDEFNPSSCWLFQPSHDINQIQALLIKLQYEATRKEDYIQSRSEEDRSYIEKTNQPASESESEAGEQMEIDWEEGFVHNNQGARILSSIQSINDDITFAGQDNSVNLYGDQLQMLNQIPIVNQYGQAAFTPNHIMPQQRDSKILMLSENDPKKIYQMDVERGTIVNEWQANNAPVKGVAPSEKLAGRTHNQTFYAINPKGIHLMDPRQPNPIAKSKIYQTNVDFTCIASNQQGNIVTGSRTGDIRLYTQAGQIAKTQLPNVFGDPIIGVDVTQDGSYVLATCKSYLLCIPVTSQGKNGFTTRLGAKKKHPKKLCILPQDLLKYGITELDFRPAKFNVGLNTLERSIVTSTGNYLVIWNFISVRLNKLEDYIIRPMDEKIINNEFKFDRPHETVVTMSGGLKLQRNRVIS